ncbi:MAG TPA: hypothetical protein VK815_12570 [Candidatus Acidoferrales bacterium]|jgi:hypothetical protein|nr:hypothetical protein [Candidatus Acidoferrales bacterium]
MKMKQLLAGSILGVALLALAPGASAVTLDFTSASYVGYETPGHPADAADVAGYVNFLITLAVNTTGTDGSGNGYVRSGNAFNNLGTAVPTTDFGTAPATVTLDGSLQYLTAHYGNGAQVVWDVLGLTGTFDVMQSGGVAGNGLSGVLGFDGSSTTTVPDGGSTVMLLGAALSGLGLVARRLKK